MMMVELETAEEEIRRANSGVGHICIVNGLLRKLQGKGIALRASSVYLLQLDSGSSEVRFALTIEPGQSCF
jgi:hypothetical protein